MRSRAGRQPLVRWWVVIGAIIVGWALTCFGSTSVEAQTVASDSATLRKLAEFRQSDNYDTVVCLAVRRESASVFVIDSILGRADQPPCVTGTTGIAANGAFDMPEAVAVRIGRMLLEQYPEFLLACAIHSVKEATYPNGVRLVVPVVWCAVRSEP